MGRDVSQVWQKLYEIEAELTKSPAPGCRHEDSEQHRVFCDDRFCIERGPILSDDEKQAA